MTKYTINKVFEKALPANIWKIETDPIRPLLAVETRNADGTDATFHVFDFQGNCLQSPCKADAKEWTLDSIQDGTLILKRIGEHTPIQEGILVMDIEKNQVIFQSYEFVLIDVFCQHIHARHRSISSGETIAIDIKSGKYSPAIEHQFQICPNKVQYPITYPKCPAFLSDEQIEGPLWLNKCADHYLWSYHRKQGDQFDLILTLSDLNQTLDSRVILQSMDKIIPQPYFQIEQQVFFMSFNKREIVSYLL